MQRKFLTIGLPILGGLLVAGVGVASAAGMFAGGGGGASMGPGGFGGAGFGSISPTQAATSQATEFQNEASALGLSESVIVAGWSEGESLQTIATANGISATQLQSDMKTFEESQQTAELQALVANGTITQTQMTARVAAVASAQAAAASRMQNATGTSSGFGGRGFGGMRGHKGSATSTTATN